MRSSLLLIPFLAGCSAGVVPIPILWPLPGVGTPEQAAVETARRGEVEVYVKSNIDAVLRDITGGGGPALTEAFNLANVPAEDRATRAFQLDQDIGLYAGSPGALVNALLLYGR